jgi:hypothetical protein
MRVVSVILLYHVAELIAEMDFIALLPYFVKEAIPDILHCVIYSVSNPSAFKQFVLEIWHAN